MRKVHRRIVDILKNFTKIQLIGILSFIFLLIVLVLTPFLIKRNQDVRSDASTKQSPQNQKNVIVFLIDDLDEASFDLMLEKGLLPNIQRYLASVGTRFRNSFITQSMCCPSRATLLTGKYSHNTGVFNVIGSESGMNEKILHDNLAVWLQDAGYQTAYVGKFMNSGKYGTAERFPGWNFWRKVSGFDTRPKQYAVFKDLPQGEYSNTEHIEPDVYQTKYIGDESVAFIEARANAGQPFFLVNAPNAVHLEWSGNWTKSNDPGLLSIDPSNPYPLVAFNSFNHPDLQVGVRQHAILGSGNSEYTAYYRDLKQPGDSPPWIRVGTAQETFQGTWEKPIVSFNVFTHPQTNAVRQHLIRGTAQDGYRVYYRELPSINWIDSGDANSVFAGTGTLPIVALSITNLNDGTIQQHLIRGSGSEPSEQYTRMISLSGQPTPWFKEGEYWDWGANLGTVVDFDVKQASNGKIEHTLIKLYRGQLSAYFKQNHSFYNSESKPKVLGESTSQSHILQHPETNAASTEEGEMFSRSVQASTLLPFGPFSGRVYADGNWPNRQPHQSYDPNLYPGGILPAGTLRVGDMQSDQVLPGFDLLALNKTSFNAVHCEEQLPWLCATWPDLTQKTLGNKQHLDYLRRQHIDRLESLISVDVMVGQVMRKLEEKGLLNSTLVIFTSDNGYFMGEHRLSNKITHYEESVRVPLIIRNPNMLTAKENRNTVSNIDLAPTILEFIGLQWNDQGKTPSQKLYAVDGRSLIPLLNSPNQLVSNWRKFLYFEHRYPRNYSIPENWRWAWAVPDHQGLRIGLEATAEQGRESVLIRYQDDPLTATTADSFYEYYDLARDGLTQMTNRFDNKTKSLPGYNSSLLSEFEKSLESMKNCSGQTCRDRESAEPANAQVRTAPSAVSPSPFATRRPRATPPQL